MRHRTTLCWIALATSSASAATPTSAPAPVSAMAPATAPALAARAGDDTGRSFRAEVQAYLAKYGATYQRLQTEWQDACWAAVSAADPSTERAHRLDSEKALTDFIGSIENIELSRAYLRRNKELAPVLQRELTRIAALAAGTPRIVPDLVAGRREDHVAARDLLTTFPYAIDGQRVTSHDLERILVLDTDLPRRRAAYESSKEVGAAERPLLVRLRWLRNECVRAMGQHDYFSYRVADCGMTPAEILRKTDEILHDLRPLQTELHTWVRYELARRYGQPVPDLIPAHWLPDPFGMNWSGVLSTPRLEIDATKAQEPPRALAGRADAFCSSMGFKPLPTSVWNLSKFTAFAPGAAGCEELDPTVWHVDLDRDVRMLLSVEPGMRGYVTCLRAMGLAHGSLSAANSDVPVVLRQGAGRLFRRSVGDLFALAGSSPRSLQVGDLTSANPAPEPMQRLLAEALDTFAYVPWAAGTVLRFESELYRDDLPADRWNARWWQLVERHQGITPPAPRDERWCDAAALPQIVIEPGDYAERGLARVLAFQLHDHIARKMLDQDPHDTCYAGRLDVGDFLRSMLRFGGTVEWRAKLREKVGADVSARALLDYFEPLRAWLEVENRGRRSTLPPL